MEPSEAFSIFLNVSSVTLIVTCAAVVIATIKFLLTAKNQNNSPFEKYSFKKKGMTLTLEIKFNEEDDRDYSEIAKEIEDAIVAVIDKRGHILVSKIRRALTDMDLK